MKSCDQEIFFQLFSAMNPLFKWSNIEFNQSLAYVMQFSRIVGHILECVFKDHVQDLVASSGVLTEHPSTHPHLWQPLKKKHEKDPPQSQRLVCLFWASVETWRCNMGNSEEDRRGGQSPSEAINDSFESNKNTTILNEK